MQQAAVPSAGHLFDSEVLPSLQSACMLCRKPASLPLPRQQSKQLLLLWVLRKKSPRPEVQSWRAAFHHQAMIQRSQTCRRRQPGSHLYTQQILMQVNEWNIGLIVLAVPMDLVMRALQHTDSDAAVVVAGPQETPRKRGQMLPPPSRAATPLHLGTMAKAAAAAVPPTTGQHQMPAVASAEKSTQPQEGLQQTTPPLPDSLQVSAAQSLRENTRGVPQEVTAPAVCSAHTLPALQRVHLPKAAVMLPTGQGAMQNGPLSLQPGQTFLPSAAKRTQNVPTAPCV